MAALSGLIAHGGLWGALAEGFVALAVIGILLAVLLRERGRGDGDEGPAGLRDDD